MKNNMKVTRKVHPNDQRLSKEYRYAAHHHLIPLYVLSGIALLAVLVLGCFLAVLWQTNQRQSYLPSARTAIDAVENLYLPAVLSPTEKKQYVYSANIRFAAADPYDTIRYTFDPGIAGTPTGSTVGITTSKTLKGLETPLLNRPDRSAELGTRLQQCAQLYAIRFEPGLTPYGGFMPLKDVKLKDGRTAYIHKNSNCVPPSVQAMTDLDDIETIISSVESY